MNPIVKNIIAVVVGVIAGTIINGGLIALSPSIIPFPEGFDSSSNESYIEGMKLFEFKHFIFPFLAHALGTLAGAFTVAKIAATHKMKFGIGMGAFFLIGGIAAVNMFPAPMWFNILDLVVAYIPMGWLGARLAGAGKSI